MARHDRMVALVEEMLRVQKEHAQAEALKEDRRHDLARQIEQLDAQIDALVCDKMTKKETVWDSLDLVYSIVQETASVQYEWASDLDTKASVVLGFDGLVLAAFLGAILQSPLVSSTGATTTITRFWAGVPYPWSRVIFFVRPGATLCVLLSFFLALVAFSKRRYRLLASPSGLYENYLAEKEQDTKLEVLKASVLAYEHNSKLLTCKARVLQASLWLLGIGMLLLSTEIAVRLFC